MILSVSCLVIIFCDRWRQKVSSFSALSLDIQVRVRFYRWQELFISVTILVKIYNSSGLNSFVCFRVLVYSRCSNPVAEEKL